jgi:hypothetical protein
MFGRNPRARGLALRELTSSFARRRIRAGHIPAPVRLSQSLTSINDRSFRSAANEDFHLTRSPRMLAHIIDDALQQKRLQRGAAQLH